MEHQRTIKDDIRAPDSERLILLSEVPNLEWLPRKPKIGQVYKWVNEGLEVFGNPMATTESAVIRFFDARTKKRNGGCAG